MIRQTLLIHHSSRKVHHFFMSILERLRQRAAADLQHIVLPEGDDPRTVVAAALCTQQKIARTAHARAKSRIGPDVPSRFRSASCSAATPSSPRLVRYAGAGPVPSVNGRHRSSKSWKAVSVSGKATVVGREPKIEFAADRVTGTGGCNGILTNNNSGAPPASGGCARPLRR